MRQGTDVATVTVWNYSGVYRFDVNGGWTSGAPLSRGTIFQRPCDVSARRARPNHRRCLLREGRERRRGYERSLCPHVDRSQQRRHVAGHRANRRLRRILAAGGVLQAAGAGILHDRRKGSQRQRRQRRRARCGVQAAQLQSRTYVGSNLGNGRRERSRRGGGVVSLRCPAARRARARLRYARRRDGPAERLGRFLVWAAVVLSRADAVVRYRRAPAGHSARRAGGGGARRCGSARPAVSDDLPSRYGGERRFESLGRRLQEFPRAPRRCGHWFGLRRRRKSRVADADSRDSDRCGRQSARRTQPCISICRR